MFRRVAVSLVLIAPLLAACGESPTETGGIELRDAWARASATQTSAAYLTIANKGGEDDTLVEARSPVAERVFEKAGEMEVEAPVRAAGTGGHGGH